MSEKKSPELQNTAGQFRETSLGDMVGASLEVRNRDTVNPFSFSTGVQMTNDHLYQTESKPLPMSNRKSQSTRPQRKDSDQSIHFFPYYKESENPKVNC